MPGKGKRCLRMSSVDEILSFVDKTEKNLKIAEHIADLFVVPVLNEWRYGTRCFRGGAWRSHTDRGKDSCVF